MSTIGVIILPAVLFVAASTPKDTPHATEITRVKKILHTVVRVYRVDFSSRGMVRRYR
jgi:hypothetical protein